MISSGTFTPTLDLGNSTGSFGEQSYPLESMYAEKVSFVFNPATDLRKGEYKLMLGGQNDVIIVMKAVKV
jgi:virginiamycin B lyase